MNQIQFYSVSVITLENLGIYWTALYLRHQAPEKLYLKKDDMKSEY